MSDYNKLNVWKKSHEAVLKIYNVTTKFPQEEKFGITSQIRRAAVSVPTNIAEGCGRIHPKDFINFLGIARGSAMEVEYLLLVSKDLNYITKDQYDEFKNIYSGIILMLKGLTESIKKTINNK